MNQSPHEKPVTLGLERIAEAVHDAWWEQSKANGRHAPSECPGNGTETYRGERTTCRHCHPDMIPYADLPEATKEYDRVTARAVMKVMPLSLGTRQLNAEEAAAVHKHLMESSEEVLTLGVLQKEAYATAVKRGQWSGDEDFPDAAEQAARDIVCETEEFEGSVDHMSVHGIEEELADIVIACLSSAEALGIDLESAVRQKMTDNAERAERGE